MASIRSSKSALAAAAPTPASTAALPLASDLAPAAREIEVISSKNQLFVLILNDDAAVQNHDLLTLGSVDLGSVTLRDAGKEKVEMLVKNNPQRYTWEVKDTTLYVYENLSVRARAQLDATPLELPFTPDITRVRFIEMYPTMEYQNVMQLSGSSRNTFTYNP
jgi:hypothetical protein